MPSPAICPRCGEPLRDGNCTRCTLVAYDPLGPPLELRLRVCPECGAVDRGPGWGLPGESAGDGLPRAAREEVVRRVSVPLPGRLASLDVQPLRADGSGLEFSVRVRVDVCGEPLEREGRARVKVRRALCGSCSRAVGSYYEATLQIRAEGRTPEQEELERCLDVVYRVVDAQRERGDPDSFVTDVQARKEGMDVYLGSAGVGRRAASELSRAFGVRMRETSSLMGEKDGRGVYRVTLAVRLPRFRAGDVVRAGRRLLVVEAVGERLKGYLLPSHRPGEVLPDEAKSVARVDEARPGVVVTAEPGGVQVVEPWGSRCVVLPPPAAAPGEGAEVPLLRVGEEIFILRGGPEGGVGD